MNIKVFKFGGASIKDAKAIKNMANIISEYPTDKLMIIVSAMGKTTNAMETVVNSAFNNNEYFSKIELIKNYHYEIINNLLKEEEAEKTTKEVDELFYELTAATAYNKDNYDKFYDSIVGYGELISTKIIYNYLKQKFDVFYADARDFIITDARYRDANVLWDNCKINIENKLLPKFNDYKLIISQGFIGRNTDNASTTLGREGSDFTAAIFAYLMNAENLTVWKDVDGLLNADPKYFENTELIENISYRETIELAFYGAKIIHPKTIKPLQNKNIPLYVKSFINRKSKGSLINSNQVNDEKLASYIFKKNQVLISITPRNLSFVDENNLAIIFERLSYYGLKLNIMQNSAISFSICIDNKEDKIAEFIVDLSKDFEIKYNENLELITIRHYNDEIIEKMINKRKVILEQKSRATVQFLVK